MENRKKLIELSDDEYKKFTSKLIPGAENILGVRIPEIRKIAKEIAAGDWGKYIKNAKHEYFEEIMLHGIVIGYINAPLEEVLPLIREFIPKISNWSVCDSFCNSLEIARKYPKEFFAFIRPYFFSKMKYEARFATVMVLQAFVDKTYIDEIFNTFHEMKKDQYYVQMAVAWTLSAFYIDYRKDTYNFIKSSKLDDVTHRMTIQKIVDSNRVTDAEKKRVRALKRK